jgi:PII-like signaling protein
MELKGEAKLLRIFLGEADKHHHRPLHEEIVRAAREQGLAGATAWRGVLGFGPSTRIRSEKVLDLSSDLPMIVEIADQEEKINSFLPSLHDLFEESGSGGLITIEKVQIIKYLHAKRVRRGETPS